MHSLFPDFFPATGTNAVQVDRIAFRQKSAQFPGNLQLGEIQFNVINPATVLAEEVTMGVGDRDRNAFAPGRYLIPAVLLLL